MRAIYDYLGEEDYLGRAAEAANAAADCVRKKGFHGAWGLLHEQKQCFLKHAVKQGFTPKQVIALDCTVHGKLAHILHLESRHLEALINLVYCIAGSPRPTKAQRAKLPAYVKLAKLPWANIKDVNRLISEQRPRADFDTIRKQVMRWK